MNPGTTTGQARSLALVCFLALFLQSCSNMSAELATANEARKTRECKNEAVANAQLFFNACLPGCAPADSACSNNCSTELILLSTALMARCD